MRYRQLDANGDYTFGHGQLNFYINEPLAVAQLVQTTLLLFEGEWYLDSSIGVPYAEGIIGKHSQAQADATFTSAIKNVQGVVSLSNYASTLDPATRAYKVSSGTINTIYGISELELENMGNF